MPPLPKKKTSTRRTGKRRAAIARPKATVTTCRHCNSPKEAHVVCKNCGKY
ncbi:50S ribosomal protein L32 [Candidatus Beckwithbacteria bacterium]|nr:50S ribosomal protein L32 [Candidatus Beckwithbacteria bacterium]